MAKAIVVIDKTTHASTQVTQADLTLRAPSIVRLAIDRDQVASMAREGDALVIKTLDGETIVIRSFFGQAGEPDSELVLQDSDGRYWLADINETGPTLGGYSEIDTVEALLVAQGGEHDALAWVAGGLALLAGGIAASSGGGGGGGHHAPSATLQAPTAELSGDTAGGLTVSGTTSPGAQVTVTFPDGSKATVTADADGKYQASASSPQGSGEVHVQAEDGQGNSSSTQADYTDVSPPVAPSVNVSANADGGLTVTGSAEAGSVVVVTFPDGSSATAIAGSDGSYSVTTSVPQTSGEVSAIATDAAGNTGPAGTLDYVDSTAPEAPVLNETITNEDGSITLGGSAEPGSTVTVTYPDGSTDSVVAGEDGTWSLTSPKDQPSGEVDLKASDEAGNTSASTTEDYSDTTAPEAPVLDQVVTNEDGSITLGGTAEPGTTVTVTYPDGSTDTVVAGEDGAWSLTSPEDQPSGEVDVKASDEAGNTSASTTEDYSDTTAPDAPSVIVTPNADGGLTVTGNAEAGSNVTVTFPDGSSQTVTAGSDGGYSATTKAPQTSGEVSATSTDAAGNTGDAGTLDYVDSTAPETPVLDEIITNEDGSITVGGTAEPGSTVTVTYPDGSTGSIVAGEDGSWSLTSPENQPSGEVDVKASDEAGNTSASTTEDYSDTTAPEAPSVIATPDADGGLTVTGSAEAGSSVTVTFPDGTSQTVIAGTDGSYSATTSVPQTSGEVSASATDAAGNTGDAGILDYVDSTAPETPVLDEIITNEDGSITVGGTAEPGSTVTVTYPDGSTDTVVAGEDGTWSLTSPEDQPSGEVEVKASDEAGNTSASTTEDYADTTAPNAPTVIVTPNADGGLTVTGSAEAGSSVTVTFPDGSSQTVTADADGSYSATTEVPQTSGEVNASATDAAGNMGEAGTFDYVDSTAPEAPVLDEIITNEDGSITIGGTAEPGSTVTVTYPDGSTDTVLAGEDGSWSLTSPENQPSGEVDVKASDEAGNTSASTTEDYSDTTAPEAPSVIVTPNADGGLTVSGSAEADSSVTVTFPDGSSQTVTADTDGSYSATTQIPQTSGEVSATATDAAGNTGEAGTSAYVDSTAPEAPVLDEIITNEDGSITLGGTAEPGSTVTVTYPDGSTDTVVAGEDGAWSLTSPEDQPSGEVDVKASDEAGNTSASTTEDYNDTTAPEAPNVIITPNADGSLTVTGNAEAGSSVTVTFPDGSSQTVTAGSDGGYSASTEVPQTSGEVSAAATDAAGNTGPAGSLDYVDSTAPEAPVLDEIVTNEDGSITVGGTAEPGSTVTVTYPDGSTDTVVAGEDGAWSLTSPEDQPSGEVDVKASDEAGNISASTTEDYSDTTAPEAPSVIVTPNADGGLTVTGSAEAGSSVTVTLPDGSSQTVTADADGSYSATTSVPQTSGEVSATATDVAGNTGEAGTQDYVDSTAPEAPVLDDIITNGDGSITVGGTAEPGSTVTVTYPDGSTDTVVAGEDGIWSLTSSEDQPSGEVEVQASDEAGNSSASTTEDYTDTTAPEAPSVIVTPNADGGLTVTGSAEANSNVTVTFPDGSSQTVTAAADGSYSATTEVPQTSGEVSATATDAAGNTGEASTLDYVDSTAPEAPVLDDIITNEDGSITIGGTAEPGSTVTVTYPDGSTDTVVAGEDGAWSLTSPEDQPSGEVDVKASDEAGNTSASTTEDYSDTTAPEAPTVTVTANADGSLTVTGNAEADSSVTVTFPDGSSQTVTAGSDGSYSVTTTVPQTSGEVSATATDAAGNTGPAGSLDYVDSTAPEAPVLDEIVTNEDGSITVGGTAEPGSTVTVTYPDGSTDTVVAGEDGTWSLTSPEDQPSGEVDVKASDEAGNTSASTTEDYNDTTAPEAPSMIITPNADGSLTVTGNAEADSSVTVTFPDGSTDTVTAGSDGSYSATTKVPQTSGEVSATATDAAGNTGPAGSLDYVDSTAPEAPVLDEIVTNEDGSINIGGTAEPGSTVTVTYPDGSTDSIVAGEDGTWSLTSPEDQPSGEIDVKASDEAGNTSDSITEDYTDTTAPEAPSVIVTPNADGGLTVSGSAEADSSVTVTFPDGSSQTVTAGSDGSYSATTEVPQTSGEVSASASDAAGNTGPASSLDYVDSTAPEAPTLDEIITNEDGSITLGGAAEPGSTVTVTYPDGSTDLVVAGEDGTWSSTSPEDQPTGEIEVKASDEAGNISASTTEDYSDTTAPEAPSVIVTPNADGGLTVTGSAEAGSSVTVTLPDGSSQTVTADADGSYSATTSVPQTSGEVSATATDAAGNTGEAGTQDYVDSTAPEAPALDEIITNEDGSITIGGTAEPGSTVNVTYPDGSTDTVVAGEDGTWSLTSAEDQPTGDVSVNATDEAGNTGPSSTEAYSDITAPEAPTVNVSANADGGLTVTGSAEAGSSVTVTFPDGSSQTVTADADGSYSATTSVPQTSGEVSASATDAAGNIGPAGTLDYVDSTAPEAPVLDEIITNEDGSITLGGIAEPGSTVTVTYPDGSTDTVVAGEDGTWSLTSPEDQPSGEIDVKASDEAGNTSSSATEDYTDTTAPEAPSVIVTPNADGGLTVTGNAEAGSTVIVTFPDGSSETVTAGTDGSYSATTEVPQTSGEVSATATDAAGNTGPAGSLAYVDSTAPEAPVLDEIITNEDGSITVGGTAEPGSTVTVTYPDGSTDTVVAGEDGAWSLTSPEDQPTGEVDVKASDEAGNTSASTTEDYNDTTAPEAPSVIVMPNADGGLTVTGNAEAGSTVTVTFSDGSSETVLAGTDGSYSAITSVPQTSGEVSATATDAAGNIGEAASVDYIDSTAPEAPVLEPIITHEDGSITVEGTAEPGSTVIVVFPDGSTESVVAGEDGAFTATSPAGQPSGDVTAAATDAAGNTGPSATGEFADTTAPEAPTLTVTANADGGLTVTGSAEADSSVTVTFPDGSSQTVTAASDGSYSATTAVPQTSGEVSATATDAAGNTGEAGTLDYIDSTAPEAPVLDEIVTNEDGSITLGGTAEPGSTVTVTYPDGSTDTVVVDENGGWSLTSPEDQPSGEIDVKASDEAGNTSASTTEDYTDTTAPDAPSVIVTPNADGGLTVTGSAEAGSSVTVTFPDGSSQTVTAAGDGSYSATTSVPQTSGEVSATATDAAGNTGDAGTLDYVDSTAPEAPMLDDIITNEDGSITVGGTAEPGSTVTVTYPDGSTDTVVAGEDGSWSLTSPEDQPSGEVAVKASDEAGNTSVSTTEDYSDTTAPEAPTVTVTPNADGGLTVTGNAEAGSSVTVTFPDGSSQTVTAGSDGGYSATTEVPQTSGEVSASATDAAGNTGEAGTLNYVDSTAPEAPMLDDIITNEDGSITVGGTAEPGSTVTVTYPDGSTDTVVAGEDGSWSLTSPEDQPSGEVAVKASDEAGNTSVSTTEDYSDTTAPEAPTVTVTPNADGGLTVTGNAEVGSSVTVTFPDGSSQTVTADADGSYSATTEVPQTSGEVSASATDAAGNTGEAGTLNYVDSTAPEAPMLDDIITNEDGSITVGGTAEPGSTVTVTYPDGSTDSVVAGEEGTWSLTSPEDQPSGEVEVKASDEAGNTSASTTEDYTDTTAPEAPSVIVTPNADGGLTVTGSAEAGSSVTVTFPDGSSQTVTADAEGNYSATTSVPQTSGEVSASATDAAGNTGDAGTLDYVDSTAPEAPVLDEIITNEDGSITVGGTAEPGSTVNVTYPDGSTDTIVADENGTWSLTSPEDQPTGEVDVKATDEAGNTSASVTEDYSDTTPPETPTVDVTANADGGLTVSGNAEPGTSVTVTFPDGSTGTVTADADGSYSVTTSVPQTSGEVSASATDAAGNTGNAASVDYVDSWAPQVPVLDEIITNTDGSITVAGSAEPGSTVTVTYPDGSTDLVVAGEDGAWSMTSPEDQPTGEVAVEAEDEAGNTSAPVTQDYTDITAPEAPTINIQANDDGGLTVTGNAEPGSTVTVTYPDGSTETVTADVDGSYSATTSVPQTSGNVSASATDAAGNTGAGTTSEYVDGTAPLAPSVVVNANTDGTLVVSGSAEAGSEVSVTFPDGSTQTVTANAAGTYSVTSASAQGSGEATAVASDAAGNSSASSSAHYALATISAVSADAGLDGDFITNDNSLLVTVTLDGELNAGDTVQVSLDGGNTWHDAVAQGDGTYVFDNSASELGDGTYVFMARVLGSEGNASLVGTQAVEIDTQGPSASLTITFDGISDDNGYLSGDYVTNDSSLGFHGTLSEPLGDGERVQISLDGGATWQDAEVDSGTWSFDNTGVELADGDYDVQVRVVDEAGNLGNSASQKVVIDTQGPSADLSITLDAISSDSGALGDDLVTSDNTLVFSGSLSAELGEGEGVEISLDNGLTWYRATVDGTGWVYDHQGQVLADGQYTVQARVVDDAGNIGQTNSRDVVVDTEAPAFTDAVIDLDDSSDNGSSASDNTTSVITPSITGTITGLNAADSEAAAAGKITVTLFDDINGNGRYDDGDVLYAEGLTLDANGVFTATLPSLVDGSYNIKAVLVDDAGNQSVAGMLDGSEDARLVIDTEGTASVAASVQSADGLGLSMSAIGDINGDGYVDYVVSAPHTIYGSTATYQSDIYVLYGNVNGIPSLSSIDNLTPEQGFRIIQSGVTGTGGDSGIQGKLVTALGDINGDGYDDFAITSTLNDRAYVIFGGENTNLATFDLSTLENGATSAGFVIKNYNTGAWPANSITGGDINGDGYSDLIISSAAGNGGNGMYVVLYGHAGDAGSAEWGNLLLRNYVSDSDPGGLFYATGTTSATLGSRVENQTNVRTNYTADATSDLGTTVKVIGDVNGDGYADYIVTAPRSNGLVGSTITNSGTAYLIWGSAEGLGDSYNLANLTSDQGVRLVGSQTGEWLGGSTIDTGGTAQNAGQWYAMFSNIQNIGDINGDGIEDFAIGSPGWGDSAADTTGPGRVYVIYGKQAGETWTDINLGNLSASEGFIISSSSNGTAISGSVTTADGQLGYAISAGGDVNGDGIDDFLIGMPGYDDGVTNRGAVYLVYGRADGSFDLNTDLDALVASGQAIQYLGLNANDYAGTGLAMGDWNGDGIADYGYGVWQSDSGATNGGAFNIYTGSIALLTHSYTVGDDELWAGSTSLGAATSVDGVDILSGGQGNDIIHGIGTDTTGTTDTSVQHDVAMGGAGDDTIGLEGTTFTRVDGGLGVDTLLFESGGHALNLTEYGTRVKGFEIFDLGSSEAGSGNNTLSLRLADVLSQVDTKDDGLGNLTIKGDSTSTVDLAETVGEGGWAVSGSTTVDGVAFDIWHNATMGSNTNADLLIQHGINVV